MWVCAVGVCVWAVIGLVLVKRVVINLLVAEHGRVRKEHGYDEQYPCDGA